MSDHLTAEQRLAYGQRSLPPAERLALSDHLAVCTDCRVQLDEADERAHPLGSAVDAVLAGFRTDAHAPPEHLGEEQLFAYVDGKLDDVDREILESHLAICDACAAEAEALRGFQALLSTHAPRVRQPTTRAAWWERGRKTLRLPSLWVSLGSAGLGAAAALLAVSLAGGFPITEPSPPGPLPATESPEYRRLRAQLDATDRESQAHRTMVQALRQRIAALTREQADGRERLAQLERQVRAREEQLTIARSEFARAQQDLQRIARQPPNYERMLASGRVELPDDLPALFPRRDTTRASGDPTASATFAVRGPVGTFVAADRPLFSWEPVAGATSYTLTYFLAPAGSNEPQKIEGTSTTTEWRPSKPLQRGKVYGWYVTAFRDGQKLAVAPATSARFKVLGAGEAARLDRDRQQATSPQRLGVVYAHYGLLDEAEAQFRRALNDPSQAQKLLDDLLARRRLAPATGSSPDVP